MNRSFFSFDPAGAAACAVILSLLVAGCGSSRSSTGESPPSPEETHTVADIEDVLRSAADRWNGVSHKWGGSTRQGVDCSGLVQSVYATQFDRSLPRTTEQQVKTGHRVDRSTLQPGDLVFFRPDRRTYHVGIYLSDGEFLHASSSEGVTISGLDRPYWNERWWQARRLLSISQDSSSSRSSRAKSTSEDSFGW